MARTNNAYHTSTYCLGQDWHKVSKPVKVRSRTPNLPAPRSTAILHHAKWEPSSGLRAAHHGGSPTSYPRSRLISSLRLVRRLRLGAAKSDLDWRIAPWSACAPRWADQASIRSSFMRPGRHVGSLLWILVQTPEATIVEHSQDNEKVSMCNRRQDLTYNAISGHT